MATFVGVAGHEAVETAENFVSRQTVRAERTRAELLRAAEVIFARDGFEASRIEDIAAEAGRSRGAFYANFANKTEVFLALRSLAVRRRARALRDRIDGVDSHAERLAAIQQYVLEQICESKTLFLQIEFKLFALRHPEMLAELSAKHLEASSSITREELPELFVEEPAATAAATSAGCTLSVEALLEGFALNALFSPETLPPHYLERLVPELLAKVLAKK